MEVTAIEASAPQVEQLNLESYKRPEDFKLKANYLDPFLKTMDQELNRDSINAIKALNTPKSVPEKPMIFWPKINYYGLVRKNSTKHPRAIVSIDGTIYKVGINEELFDGIILLHIDRDKIDVRYQKETKSFFK